jgi:hypothetical protein
MHLVLDLADKYPRNSLAAHILDCVAQFLPMLLCPCTRRDRVRQIISSVKRFQHGDWKDLRETALCLAQRETDTATKRSHNRAKRDTSSIQTRVVYAEHCAWLGTLSKANQPVTSNSVPHANPCNMDTLRAKHPEPAHPDRDPVLLSSILWSQSQNLEDFWSSDAGSEWHARDIITPSFFNDNTDLHTLIRKRLILPYLTGSFHPSFVEEDAGGLLMALEKQDRNIHPFYVERYGTVALTTYRSMRRLGTHNEPVKSFTCTYDKFIQTASIRDGASYCAKILSIFYDNLDDSTPNDPDSIIKIDVSNAFNTTDRAFTLDMISGRASRDYTCGFK